jgi:hypothetical protein
VEVEILLVNAEENVVKNKLVMVDLEPLHQCSVGFRVLMAVD